MRDTDLSHDLNELAERFDFQSRQWFPEIYADDAQLPLFAYFTLAMVGEAGELANLVKKVLRDGRELSEVADELADVTIYLLLLYKACGIDPIAAIRTKEAKLYERWGEPRR